MLIYVNGESREVQDDSTIDHLLTELGIKRRFLAVEHNEQIVPREQFVGAKLAAGDRVEIVTLVGGG